MCGLFGVFSTGTLSKKEKDIFESLGILSTPRGKHSTGVCQIKLLDEKDKYDCEYRNIKDTCQPSYFFNRKEWKNTKSEINHGYIGHNRHATVGDVSRKAAHPFITDYCVGTHNGTLKDYLDEKQEGDKYVSDSHKFYSELEKTRDFRPVIESLGEDSAYVFIWMTWNGKLHFFRNSQRSLFLAVTKSKRTIFWASERRFLEAVEKLHDIDFEVITALPRNVLGAYHFKKNGRITMSENKDFLDLKKITKHERKVWRNTNNNSGVGDNWWREQGYGGARETTPWRANNNQSLLPRRNNSSGVNYSFDFRTGAIRRTSRVTHNQTYTTRTFSKGNPEYDEVLHEMCAHTYGQRGLPYLCINDDISILVYLPENAKGKRKIKTIPLRYKQYRYWLEIQFMQYREHISEITRLQKIMTAQSLLCMKLGSYDYNTLRRDVAFLSLLSDDAFKKLCAKRLTLSAFHDNKELEEALPESVEDEEEKETEKKEKGLLAKVADVIFLEDRRKIKEGVQIKGYKYWNNNIIDLNEASKKLSKGCSGCSSPMFPEDEVYWLNHDDFLCGECMDDHTIYENIPQKETIKRGEIKYED